jgi:hypothetical protein
MNLKLSLAAASLAAGLLIAAMPGMAAGTASLATLKTLGAEQHSAVEQAHFWHRTCRRGLNGWHKHVPGVGRVQCTNHTCRHGKCFWY